MPLEFLEQQPHDRFDVECIENQTRAAPAMNDAPNSEASNKVLNTHTEPVMAYIFACVVSWVSYVVGTSKLEPVGIVFALYILIAGGFLPGQALMAVPWAMAARVYRRTRVPGWLYFPALGGAGIVMFGCISVILVPKLLVVEDQTFLETTVFTLQRDGVSLVITGVMFGLTYWFLGVRPRS